MGGIDEVFKVTKILNVIDNGLPPSVPESLAAQTKAANLATSKKLANKKPDKKGSITKFYDEYKEALTQSGAHYEKAEPGKQFDLGGGARLTILGPSEPYFTREQMKSGGNEQNANSVVVRLDYGAFSMLLPADAEDQTEHRLLTKDLNLRVIY